MVNFLFFGSVDGMDISPIVAKLQDLQGPCLGVEKPVPAHTKCGVLVQLLDAITAAVPRVGGDDLDHDIGRVPQRASPRQLAVARQEHGNIGLATAAVGERVPRLRGQE